MAPLAFLTRQDLSGLTSGEFEWVSSSVESSEGEKVEVPSTSPCLHRFQYSTLCSAGTSSGPTYIANGALSFDSTQDSSVVALRIGDVVVRVRRGMQVEVGSGLGLGGNEGGTLTWCDMESNSNLVLGLIG